MAEETEKTVIAPQSEFQAKFLNSEADITIAGGAAGSGKSFLGLLRHVRAKDDPHYVGYCIRKNSSTIMSEGGLFEEARDLYLGIDKKLKIREKTQKMVFSSGASVSFSHYENDKASLKYHGLQLTGVFYDEATHAKESHIWWLISRLRSTKSKIKPKIWLTCNPDPDSYLREWVDWWLYPEGHENAGLPNPERNGQIRWLLRVAGELHWADTKEELVQRFKKPNLPIDHEEQPKPLSVMVVLGTIYDNPILIKSNPEYLSNLEAQPETDKQRLLYGNWNAREKASTYFQREWIEVIDKQPSPDEIIKVVRAYDLAGTLKSDKTPDPDYTVSVKLAKLVDNTYCILDLTRVRISWGNWTKYILENASYDGRGVDIIIPQDPASAGKFTAGMLVRDLMAKGYVVRVFRASNGKLDRFRPYATACENGLVKAVRGVGFDSENNISGLNPYYNELEKFTGVRRSGEDGHDDFVDASSDAYEALVGEIDLRGVGKAVVNANQQMFPQHKTPFYLG